jgi:hypothetical protein
MSSTIGCWELVSDKVISLGLDSPLEDSEGIEEILST